MSVLNKACSIAYETALLLFFLVAILAPFHAASTEHFVAIQSFDDSHAVIVGDTSRLRVGQTLPLYRFSHQWKSPIGEAIVQGIRGEEADIVVAPKTMPWPLGRHAKIGRDDAGNLYAAMGGAQLLNPGDELNIFRDEQNLARVTIIRIEAGRSYFAAPAGVELRDIEELHASEYTIVTQAAAFPHTFLSWVEILIVVLSLVGYALLYLIKKRSPFMLLGDALRTIPLPRSYVNWTVNILAGVPFVWFMTKMPLYLGAYLITWVQQSVFGKTVYLYPLADSLFPLVFGILIFAYYALLLWKRRSPVLLFWKFISYPSKSLGTGASGVITHVSFRRGIIMWALHLAIVYAFGWTLLGFLIGDIRAATSIGLHPGSAEAFFEMLKYSIWALTVVGVLIGYGYSVVSILWGKYIRNLDFTVTGWLTNAFCYPLLGVVIWHMIPAFTGLHPIVTDGPLQILVLVLGLVLNLLYMLTIFNLWTLFDLMADKGVRTSLFYSTVRHPSYTLEVSMFFVTELVGLSLGIQWLAISMYFFIYWIRSEREDNFMEYSNPDYTPYQAATPYKFIPGIY